MRSDRRAEQIGWEKTEVEQKTESQSVRTTGKIIIYTMNWMRATTDTVFNTLYHIDTYMMNFGVFYVHLSQLWCIRWAHNIVQITTKHAFFFFFYFFTSSSSYSSSFIHFLFCLYSALGNSEAHNVCVHKLNHTWRWYTQKMKNKQRRMNTIVSSFHKTTKNEAWEEDEGGRELFIYLYT